MKKKPITAEDNENEPKKIGDVFLTENLFNKCRCGKKFRLQHYVKTIEGEKLYEFTKRIKRAIIGHEIFVGFCECGNVFLSKFDGLIKS